MASYDLANAAKHIVHDYAYLVSAGNDTQKPLRHPFNHYAERTFLIHCRAFAKFFDNNGTDTRDMYAKDFVHTPIVSNLTAWGNWHKHIDKHLAHLTKERITNTTPWTGADNKKILDEFRLMWQDFYKNIDPSLRPVFDAEIAAMQQQFPGVPL
jgi:hypothetical protein